MMPQTNCSTRHYNTTGFYAYLDGLCGIYHEFSGDVHHGIQGQIQQESPIVAQEAAQLVAWIKQCPDLTVKVRVVRGSRSPESNVSGTGW